MSYIQVSCLVVTNSNLGNLKRTLDSIYNQTHRNKDVIIINNGSFLYKLKVQKYLKNVPLDIKYIKTNEKHYNNVVNLGIEASRSNYIALFDTSDIHDINRIQIQMDECIKYNMDATVLKNCIVNNKESKHNISLTHGLYRSILFRNPKNKPVFKHILNDNNIVDILKHNQYKIHVISTSHQLYEYNFHNKSDKSDKYEEHLKNIIKNFTNK